MDNTEKEYAPLINQLKSLKAVKASDKFRERVALEMIPSLPSSASWLYLPTLSMRLAITCLLLIILGGGGLVFAAEKSYPGEPLYPVKKAIENVKLSLSKNPAVKMLLYLDNADKRIEELKETIKKDNNKEIKNITSDYESQVKEAVKEIKDIKDEKEHIIKKVNQQLENQSKRLEEIQQAAPTTFVPAIQKAIETSKEEQKALEPKEIPDLQPIR